jgi:two-component system alkaline phosphatase synthesis response regulator PhoP
VKKILIVDDEPFIRTLLEETLEELEDAGAEVLVSSDGVAGWETIQTERPDLVFLDVMMPRMSGYEVCQRVKQDASLRSTYVILLTAKGQEVDRERGAEVGADEYITKPFDPDHVIETAQRVLDIIV